MNDLLDIMRRELLIRNYSGKTMESYLHSVNTFLSYQWDMRMNQRDLLLKKNDGPFEIATIKDDTIFEKNPITDSVKNFLLNRKLRGDSPSTLNLYLNAIRFFYFEVLKRPFPWDIKFAKRPVRFPTVLTRKEIREIIDSIANEKHRLIIALAYGSGLRVSEVMNLQIKDIDFQENFIHVRDGKGKKDRLSILPKLLRPDFQKITERRGPQRYLFESMRGGKLTTRTAQKVFEQAIARVKIRKKASFHSLRHSFATHLLENGVDVRYIQELLGHVSIRTTQKYITLTKSSLKNIDSPLGEGEEIE